MRGWIFHSLNIIILLLMSVFNLFAWFGNALSAVSTPGISIVFGVSYILWGIFYVIQSLKNTNIWRITWFLISLIVLWYWEFGGGTTLYNFLFIYCSFVLT
ncbi:hypothetical protein [Gracilibacillus thailandensis]|uniref:Uncharacterized protein n=1 Tax=Gracilibacillus thailandensis TaxID=563735 RepID=A0A6N7R1E0_9BACI|nr:hypothetical protein [Gracilibacillus thailandensis]MRI67195.1 hypothetical protein [Gracilibacillus thailandensis]